MVSETDEVRKTGDIGGQPKMTYWTPDGQKIRAMPDMHEYTRKDVQGKVIENGIRDANLDKGWLLQPPTELKLTCPHCHYWHDTEKEIKECGIKRNTFISKVSKKASKELGTNSFGKLTTGRIDVLENDIVELKKMMKQLITAVAKGGK